VGVQTLGINKGEQGALVCAEDTVFSAPAYPLEDLHDPTGAGDTFLGGFAGHLARLQRYDAEAMKQAVVVGSALASFVVEAFGPERLLDLDPAAVDERMGAFHRLSAIPEGLLVVSG